MIFVTVGTHEQPFDRLVKEIDTLKLTNKLTDDIFIQSGYCEYSPEHCKYQEFISFQKMNKFAKQARIIITHGGPGSIMLALNQGKIPIVVPRQEDHGEHVDNHQVLFTKRLDKKEEIIGVYEIEKLYEKISRYDELCKQIRSSNQIRAGSSSNISAFIKKLDEICDQMRTSG